MWRPDTYLLATVVDVLLAANWQRAGKGPRPEPVPRPGAAKRQKKYPGIPLEEARRRMGL